MSSRVSGMGLASGNLPRLTSGGTRTEDARRTVAMEDASLNCGGCRVEDDLWSHARHSEADDVWKMMCGR